MAREAIVAGRQATLSVNKATGAVRFNVPQGTTLVDAVRALQSIDLSKLARLPRGCLACLSGQPFDIREQFDPVINVRLGQG